MSKLKVLAHGNREYQRTVVDRIGRVQFMLELKENGIQTQVHYIPVDLQPYSRRSFGTKEGDSPNAEQYYEKYLSIPRYPAITVFKITSRTG